MEKAISVKYLFSFLISNVLIYLCIFTGVKPKNPDWYIAGMKTFSFFGILKHYNLEIQFKLLVKIK